MDFVILLSWRGDLTEAQRDEALMRRGSWTYPKGLTPISEYWTTSVAPAVVVIATADSYAAIWELAATWQDKFDIEVLPAVSAEQGLQIGPGVLANRVR